MFLGHFGVGFAAKRVTPAVSLGTLFLAAQFVDLLWPTLLLTGFERVEIVPGITRVTPLDFVHYPITHSLLMALGWGLAFGAVYAVIRKHKRGAVVCGVAVMSHWVLDLVVHRPDLPLVPGGHTLAGFGLWNSLGGTLVAELGVLGLGVWLYSRTTRSVDRTGSIALWSLVGFLLLVYVGNVFGPPPDSVGAIAWVGHAQWLLIVWGYWIDRHRTATVAPHTAS